MAQEVKAELQREVTVRLTANFSPGYAGDRENPPEPDRWEDIEIADIGIEERVRVKAGELEYTRWEFKSLLTNIDRKSPFFIQLEQNILSAIGEEEITSYFEDAQS